MLKESKIMEQLSNENVQLSNLLKIVVIISLNY